MLKQKGFAVVVAAMLLMLFLNVQAEGKGEKERHLPYGDFVEKLENGEIAKVYYSDEALWQLETKDGQKMQTENPRKEGVKETMLLGGVEVVEKARGGIWGYLCLLGGMAFLFSRKTGAMEQFANAEAETKIPGKTFQDVVMDEETKLAMQDLVHYLKQPSAYEAMGARPPRGVLLYGPPGTGKTLIAQALAGETGKGFFAVSGSDFVQVYVGVGASRIRSLFKKARKQGGGVIFMDEIDALGKKRDNANDEREQTLNALLTEMNGFHGKDGIIVLAATNRPDTLDGALLREGRFDRRIEIGLPDAKGRKRMLEVHTKNKPLSDHVNLDAWAGRTTFFTGAQLESMVNEAAIRAVREGEKEIGERHMEKAYLSQMAGDERPLNMSEKEKRIIAVHEAGHAVLTHHLLPDSTLTRVTILPSSKGAAGYSLSTAPDRVLYTRKELLCRMAVALGGRMAEEMVFGRENVTNGASNDLEKVEAIAKQMAAWRMAEGEKGAENLIKEAENLAKETLRQEERKLQKLTDMLLKKETLCGEEIRAIVA